MIQSTPLPRRSAEEQIRLETTLREVFEHKLRFNEVLGLKVASFNPEAPQLEFAMRPELIGHYLHGRLHGGVIAAALDTVGGFAVTVGIAEKFCNETVEQFSHRFGRIGTIDLRVDYLRPGIGQHFEATASVIRLGGRIASTQMSLLDPQGQLIATGAAAYIVS